jgi:hypothetical protein
MKGESDIGEPLFFFYSQIKSNCAKLRMIMSLLEAMDNEDVLLAISIDTYRAVLDFALKVFSAEKAKIEEASIRASTQSYRASDQNDLTVQVQKIVSKLLNSKEFTTSLTTLFHILRLAMPADLSIELTEE